MRESWWHDIAEVSHPGGALLKFLNIRTMINKLVAVYPQSAPALLCTALQVSWQRGKFPKLFGLSIPLPLGNHVPSDGVPRSWFLLFQYRNNPSVTAACSVQTIQWTDSNIIRTSSQHWTPLDAERGKQLWCSQISRENSWEVSQAISPRKFNSALSPCLIHDLKMPVLLLCGHPMLQPALH